MRGRRSSGQVERDARTPASPPLQPCARPLRGDRRSRRAKAVPRLLSSLPRGADAGGFPDHRSGRHSPGSDEDFREHVRHALQEHGRIELDDHWDKFAKRLSFVVSSADDGSDLAQAVTDAESEVGAEGERLIYLSVPPAAMQAMVAMLGNTGIAERCSLVVEKPFGHDVASARELNDALHAVLPEESIYRIDHFLGKEAAQNILVARFANGILEPVWNRDHIEYVQIDVPEELDIQGRAGFYEQTGAFRDMVVTHLMQILGIVALEPPSRIDAGSLHIERTKVFAAIRPLDPERVVFGQYEGYRNEEGVADDSRVETFAAAEVYVDTWRWSGVPFYLRTGKAMAQGRRTVTIGFSEAPLRMFPNHDPDNAVRPRLSSNPSAVAVMIASADVITANRIGVRIRANPIPVVAWTQEAIRAPSATTPVIMDLS